MFHGLTSLYLYILLDVEIVAGSLADEGSDEVDHVSHLSEDVTPPAKRKKKKQRKKVQVSDIRLTVCKTEAL